MESLIHRGIYLEVVVNSLLAAQSFMVTCNYATKGGYMLFVLTRMKTIAQNGGRKSAAHPTTFDTTGRVLTA